jgi:hypothetical protein
MRVERMHVALKHIALKEWFQRYDFKRSSAYSVLCVSKVLKIAAYSP